MPDHPRRGLAVGGQDLGASRCRMCCSLSPISRSRRGRKRPVGFLGGPWRGSFEFYLTALRPPFLPPLPSASRLVARFLGSAAHPASSPRLAWRLPGDSSDLPFGGVRPCGRPPSCAVPCSCRRIEPCGVERSARRPLAPSLHLRTGRHAFARRCGSTPPQTYENRVKNEGIQIKPTWIPWDPRR